MNKPFYLFKSSFICLDLFTFQNGSIHTPFSLFIFGNIWKIEREREKGEKGRGREKKRKRMDGCIYKERKKNE